MNEIRFSKWNCSWWMLHCECFVDDALVGQLEHELFPLHVVQQRWYCLKSSV